MFLHERAIFHRLFAILGRGHILLKFLIYVSGKVITLLRFQALLMIFEICTVHIRVSVQGVKSLGGHFACLCQGFEFYEVKKKIFFKKKMEILLHFLSFL